jgi:hypothetical protein
MTNQIPPLPASLDTMPVDSDLFPPSFLETVEFEFRKTLNRDHPGVMIDFQNTWLTLYEYKARNIPPYTDFPSLRPAPEPRWDRRFNESFRLCDSLIDYFLGALNLEEESVGLFTVADSVSVVDEVLSLTHKQLVAIYRQCADSMSDAYNESLIRYWSAIGTDGKTRRALFIDERAKALLLEARAGVDQKTLTTQQGAMLAEMLRYSRANNSTSIKKHGVFSLSLGLGDNALVPFTGLFIITHANEYYSLEHEGGRLGAVVLYSPNNGLEGFDSLLSLSESLVKRLRDPAQKVWLLKNVPLELAFSIKPSNDEKAATYAWNIKPMEADFLSELLASQIIKQQSDFLHCVKTSKTLGFKSSDFLEALSQSLDPYYQFDNFLNLNWNDKYILYTSMPHWWQAMSTENKDSWLISAKTVGNSIIDLTRLTEKHLTNPLTNDQSITTDYIDTVIATELKEREILLTADEIFIDVVYSPALLPPYFPHLAVPANPEQNIVKRYSLRSLATEKPSTLKLESAHSVIVTGKNGEALKRLDKTFIADLSERLSNRATIKTFLVERLENSTYAKSLLIVATRLSRMQMRMGLLSATAQDVPQPCLEWIKSVIDAPEASADRQVKGQKILVTFLAINDVTLSNVLKIAPQDSSEQGMVLCTLNAPDGIVFRWFANMASAKSGFLDKPDFSHYLMLQIPIANRPRALRSLQLDQRLTSYRFPEFFKYLPSPVPIPGLLWEAVSFVEQTRDFLTENHDLKIAHLLTDATANLLSAREIETQQNYTAMHMSVSIILLFLPPPVSIPIALGLGLYKAWNGFRAIEEDDFEGAAREFLFALDYLVTAGIGKLALASKPLLPILGLRQPIARRIGADGEPHIGILLQHPAPGLSGTGEGSVLFDALKFHRIEINNQAFYVRPHANLFGHKKLYRRHPEDSSVLTELDEFALRSNEGQWLKAPYQASGIGAQTYLKASQHLDRLIAEWPTSVQQLTPLQHLRFEADYLSLANSNTHLFPEVEAYSEGGSAAINNALRANIVSDDAAAFVREFYQLDEYRGQAYRAAYVSTNGLERLQGEPGTIFADKGIQSASISPLNASRWSDDDYIIQSANPDDRAIFMIFDPSIPKKNMFTSFLGDHVGIAPETPLQLMAFKTVDNVNYAYFSAPEQIPQLYIDTYTGRQAAFS